MDTRQVNIPNWLISVLKTAGTIVIALAIGYARFIGVETQVNENKLLIQELRAKTTAMTDMDNTMDRRLNTLEVTQKINEKGITDSLARIESVIKDIKADVRELQTKSK